jgi:molybdopterin converting factor small subunit
MASSSRFAELPESFRASLTRFRSSCYRPDVPTVHFTQNLRRHVQCPTSDVQGSTVGEVLEAVFADNPKLRGYVLDDRGAVRKHMNVFVNGEMIEDRVGLRDTVASDAEIYVMQALSGG